MLFPVEHITSLVFFSIQDILHQFPAVRTWINTIQSQKAVQEAINEVTRGTGAKAFKVCTSVKCRVTSFRYASM